VKNGRIVESPKMESAGSTERPGRILVVDDEQEIVAFIEDFLTHGGFNVLCLTDPREVMNVLPCFQPDVCILDFRMPHLTGAAVLDLVKHKDSSIEIIFLTAQEETSLAVDLMKRGAIDFLLKPVELKQLSVSLDRAFEHQRLVRENDAYRLYLEKLVAEKTVLLNTALSNLTHVHSATLDALSMALDFRDQSTSGHSRRVATLTAGVAKNMGIDGSALVQIEHGALLHDIGKLKIPDSILWKPTTLTTAEWATMRRHAEYGFDFLNRIDFLKDAAELVRSHHEKFDGTGYPRGLRGEDIPFGARVFAIVDAVDAMIYKRPYNQPMSFRSAAEEVRRCSGTQFDPELIHTTLDYLFENLPREKTKAEKKTV
jgi:putative nucleotidyltransferase with HDIG domain